MFVNIIRSVSLIFSHKNVLLKVKEIKGHKFSFWLCFYHVNNVNYADNVTKTARVLNVFSHVCDLLHNNKLLGGYQGRCEAFLQVKAIEMAVKVCEVDAFLCCMG